MLPRLKGGHCLGVVEEWGRGDVDEVHVLPPEELAGILDILHAEPRGRRQRGGSMRARHANELDARHLGEVLEREMAEAAAAASITGEHPVMLLDDVLSELDDGRKQYLLTRMREKQTFVTSCDDTAFLKTDGEVYRMNGGMLTKV